VIRRRRCPDRVVLAEAGSRAAGAAALAHLRQGVTSPDVAAGFGLGTAAA